MNSVALKIALNGLCMIFPEPTHATQWAPPANANPMEILTEARKDRDAGDYATALLKYLWLHQEGAKKDPAFDAVRLSFAVADWADLAKDYSPALVKLKEVREVTCGQIKASADKIVALFREYVAINRVLNEQELTVELFRELEEGNEALGKELFRFGRDAFFAEESFDIFKIILIQKQTSKKSCRITGEIESESKSLATRSCLIL